jgi:15-cis-phytoene synthase
LTEADITRRRFDERYVALMRSLIARTREFFAAGMPLAEQLEGALRVDIDLFSRGGLAVLDAIEDSGYNTLEQRPAISKFTQLELLGGALVRRAFTRSRRDGDGRVSRAARAANGTNATSASVSTMRSSRESDAVRASYAECNRIARASRSSFYLAFFGLPKPKRDALCALYAFMRLVDDVSDETGDLESKRRGLAQWRAKLDESVGGRADGHPILPALADTIARFEIPTRYFHDLISGAEMDLSVASYATFDRLAEYCYRVAGTVGLTCLYVFGFRDPRSPDLAERLGLAFQLTNIIRDVRADFEMGRVYLPDEDIERFGCASENLRGPVTAGLRDLLAFEAERAWRLYEEGAPLVDQVDADSRATLAALIRTYSTLLARIEEREFDVFSSRVSLSSAEKVQYLLAARIGWKKDVLAKRSGDRRRSGGLGLRRRAG